MNDIYIWIIPPLVGAVIGYVTNAIAIKMLFRPLKPYFLFKKFRIPFTPGILPRKREQLADNIGAMVQRELITPEILKERLRRPDVHAKIKESVALYTGIFLDTPLNNFSASGALSTLLTEMSEGIRFDSLRESIVDTIVESSRNLTNQSLRAILGDVQTENLLTTLEQTISNRLETQAAPVIDRLRPGLENALPGIELLFIRFLNRWEVRAELETHGRTFLSGVFKKMNGVQRLFFSAGQYDKTLIEQMPEIIEDFIGQIDDILQDQSVQIRMINFFTGSIEQFLTAPGSSEKIASVIRDFIAEFMNKNIETLLPKLTEADVRAFITKMLERLPQAGASFFKPFFKKFMELHGTKNLSYLLSLSPEKKEKADDFLCETLLKAVDGQIEEILNSIDVQALVRDRINELEMIDVERIVLDVMANQFKWINVFGAILGALIGIVQSVLSRVM